MMTFQQFLECKQKEKKSKLRLGLNTEGEPTVVGGSSPKKGKLKMVLSDEGEPTVVKK